MISFGSKSGTSTTNARSQSDPWDVTVPYLARFIQDLDPTRALIGPTGDQLDAFAALKQRAAQGNPYATGIDQLAKDQLAGVDSRSGMVDDVYKTLQGQLGDVAAGKNLDIMSDPRIQAMLASVGNDVQNRISGIFAGSGRNVSGNASGQGAIAKGVSDAQLPILFNEFARQQGRTDAAARDLSTAGNTAATTGQGLDSSALAGRSAGVDTSTKALQAGDYAENSILNLDQQLKGIPTQDLASYASLLLPVAGLGGQQQGTSTTNSTQNSSGLNLGLGDIGKIGSFALSLSDEREKQNVERVGETDDGQPLYRYQYKGDPAWHVGLIAQEVEKVKPAAVKEVGGRKYVDIKRATDAAARKGTY